MKKFIIYYKQRFADDFSMESTAEMMAISKEDAKNSFNSKYPEFEVVKIRECHTRK